MKIILNYAQYKYLRDNDILDRYKKAVNSISCSPPLTELNFSEYNNFLSVSFSWDNTEEGVKFWLDHDEKSKDLHHTDLYTLEI